jgi:hypothetical protein
MRIKMAARKWTNEQKARQATIIQNWKPWQHSTGAKTPEGKASSSMNAHRGYFRRRARLGRWLLWARYHTSTLTPELIHELKKRADKLKLWMDIGLDRNQPHEEFFNIIAIDNMNAAMDESCEKMMGFYLRMGLILTTKKTVLGNTYVAINRVR